jgi:hypothetical protein
MGLILFFRLIKMIGANNFKMFGPCTKKEKILGQNICYKKGEIFS